MHRMSERNAWITRLMLIMMAVLVVAAVYHAYVGAYHEYDDADGFDGKTMRRFSGKYGQIVDRSGNLLMDNDCQPVLPDIMGGVIGGIRTSTDAHSNYGGALYDSYPKELAPDHFSRWSGIGPIKQHPPKIMETTLLSAQAHEQIANCFGDHEGAAFVMNYETGEVYLCLSLPGRKMLPVETSTGDTVEQLLFSNVNRCTEDSFMPGSTMKTVALMLALEQGRVPEETFVCNGSFRLLCGKDATCEYTHGSLNTVDATAVSCNCYYANMLQGLDATAAQESLQRMGFVNHGDLVRSTAIGDLRYTGSVAPFNSVNEYESIWSLIGESSAKVTPIQMARVIGAVAAAAEGKPLAEPYFIERIYDPYSGTSVCEHEPTYYEMFSQEVAQKETEILKASTNMGYRSGRGATAPEISFIKTGTNEVEYGNDRTLIGVLEDYKTSFFLIVLDVDKDDPEERAIIHTVGNEIAKVIVDNIPLENPDEASE